MGPHKIWEEDGIFFYIRPDGSRQILPNQGK